MTRFSNVIIENAVLCEDIRQEVRNKNTLVGIYAGDIMVSQLPANIDLAFYLDGKYREKKSTPMEVRISGPGRDAATAPIEFAPIGDTLGFAMISPRMRVQLEQEGEFKVSMRELGGSWKTLIAKKVTLNADLADG